MTGYANRQASPSLGSENGTPEVLLTAREVAERLGVSSETVLRWTRCGRLPGFRLPGGALRYRSTDLDAWLAARATPTIMTEAGGVRPPGAVSQEKQTTRRGGRDAGDPAGPGVQAQLW